MAISGHDATKAGVSTSDAITPAAGVVTIGADGTKNGITEGGQDTYYRYGKVGASKNDQLYFEYSFSVSDGYTFTPTEIDIEWAPSGGGAVHFDVYTAEESDKFTQLGATKASADKVYTKNTIKANSPFTKIRLYPYGKDNCDIILNNLVVKGKIEATKTKLSTPEITFTENGLVTIMQSEGKDVFYTTNGTIPSSGNGTKYEAPFNVADGTTVKAIAVGDGVTTSNSDLAERLCLYSITIETPVIKVYNGTVAISCSTPYAKVEYSINNNGYQPYTRTFTLTEDATISVKASREGSTTATATAEIAVPAAFKTKTIYMGWGSFDLTKTDGVSQYSTLNGKEGDDAYGYSLILNNLQKDWQQDGSGKKISCPIGDRTGIKVSNGAQNILRLPEGIVATRLTIYSYVNKAEEGSRTSGWKEVNDITIPYADVPMSMFSDNDMRFAAPDVRIFPLDNATGEITFTNTGEQVCFILALDVIEPVQLATADTDLYSLYLDYNAAIPAGITAYTGVLDAAETTLTLQPVAGSVLPAGTAVVVKSDAPGTFVFESTTATAAETGENSLRGVASDTDVTALAEAGKTVLTLGMKDGKIGFRRPADTQIKANRAYLLVSETNMAKQVGIVMGGATAISEVGNAADANTPARYNLAGQRVEAKAKGLLISNGKKHIAK